MGRYGGMKEILDILGAVTAYVIFVSSIVTFVSRMVFKSRPGHWLGVPILLMAFPLTYPFIRAPAFDRSRPYYV
jgi:hypothetical protein